MRHMLARVGWKPDFVEKSVPVLPISGWMGDNLIKQSTNMAWWKGQEVVSLDNRKVQINCLLDVSTQLAGCGSRGGQGLLLGCGKTAVGGCLPVAQRMLSVTVL
jgi:elongation factor 1-alpha